MAQILENVRLADFSNYRIGGPARYFFHCKSAQDMEEALAFIREKGIPLLVMGGGTNILIDDKGFPGAVVKCEIDVMERTGCFVRAGAGAMVSELTDFCTREGLSGLEWAGGLPGTVGGGVRGNAGAFGGEMKDRIKEVLMLDVESGNIISFSDVDCQFGYRDSIFKRNVGLLLEATFFLEEGDSEKIRASTREKIEYRRSNHPMDLPSLGSTFKNVPISDFPGEIPEEFPIKTDPFPVVPAAYLISKAGLSGARSGGAEISQKHPNFIVNLGEAKAADIKKLISSIKETVKEKFGVDLKEEIQIL